MAKALEIYKIPIDKERYLYTMPAPIKGANQDFYAQDLIARDIKFVLSLLSPVEIEVHGLNNQQVCYDKLGLGYQNFPITDFGTPHDKDAFVQLVKGLSLRIKDGENIAIHCKAGIGRSSLLAGALLLTFGHDAREVFKHITKFRGLQVPDKQSQAVWLIENEHLLK